MKSEAQIKERLAELYDVAKIKDPSLEKYTEPPIVKINDESLIQGEKRKPACHEPDTVSRGWTVMVFRSTLIKKGESLWEKSSTQATFTQQSRSITTTRQWRRSSYD